MQGLLACANLRCPRRRASYCIFILVIALVTYGSVLYLTRQPDPRIFLTPRPSSYRKKTEFFEWQTSSLFYPVSQNTTGKSTEELCRSFPREVLQNIQPILRIGHSDVGKPAIDAQLNSVSACLDNLVIFSDTTEDVTKDHVSIDVLADVSQFYRQESSEFRKNYDALRKAQVSGRPDSSFDGKVLDKYKFLPMIERAWKMRPERPWYIFYEVDTYIFWDNMLRFLDKFDPDHPLYIGSPSRGRSRPDSGARSYFANGGPGIIMSRGAMKKFLERKVGTDGEYTDAPLAEQWADHVVEDCCGDSVLGWALYFAGIPVSGFWPMFNPHPAHGLAYSEDYWCQPILTLHKTKHEDVVDLWKWETERRQQEMPLLHRDLYDFKRVEVAGMLEDWDNGSWGKFRRSWKKIENDKKATAAKTPTDCLAACQANSRCAQWTHHGEECTLARSFMHGLARKPESVGTLGLQQEKYTSGWMPERIDKWRSDHTCPKVQWVRASITRVW